MLICHLLSWHVSGGSKHAQPHLVERHPNIILPKGVLHWWPRNRLSFSPPIAKPHPPFLMTHCPPTTYWLGTCWWCLGLLIPLKSCCPILPSRHSCRSSVACSCCTILIHICPFWHEERMGFRFRPSHSHSN